MPNDPNTAQCPKCEQTSVGSNDTIAATAQGCWVLDEGVLSFEASGYTLIAWDTQTPVAQAPCRCEDCGWTGTPDQLLVP
jgi:hypothetical protein